MPFFFVIDVCINVLDTRLDGFTQNRNPLCRQLIEGANEALIALVESEYFPIWKLVETKGYKLLTEIDLLFYK